MSVKSVQLVNDTKTASEVTPIVLTPGIGGFAYISVGTVTGTTPTLDVTLKELNPIDGKLYDLVSFTQITLSDAQEKVALPDFYTGSVVADIVIGGTVPSFPVVVSIVTKG